MSLPRRPQFLPKPRGHGDLLKGVRGHAHGDIFPLHHQFFLLAAPVAPVPSGDRRATHVEHADFHVDAVPVAQSPSKVALQADRGKGDVAPVKHIREVDAQLALEELLNGQVKVVHEAGIVNDSSIVDVSETHFNGGAKGHGFLRERLRIPGLG
jgi:hypothetical protein